MTTVAQDGLLFEEPGDLSMRRSQAIVRSYLVLTGLFTLAASLMWAVNALFLLDAGLDIFEVFVVNAAFTVGLVLFEIPTGIVADSAGRRRSFLLSVFILIIGTVGYLSIAGLGGGLAGFVIVSLILGIGYSFYSGAAEAWLVDALHAVGHDGQLDRIFARRRDCDQWGNCPRLGGRRPTRHARLVMAVGAQGCVAGWRVRRGSVGNA